MKSMLRLWCLVACAVAAPAVLAQAPAAPASVSPAYGVTYIEALPGASGKALALLRILRAASRKADGSVRFEIFQRRERPHHFAIIEAWKDTAAFEASLASAPRKKFRDDLSPLLAAGYDERPHSGLAVGEMNAALGAKGATVFTVTHVDFIPPKKDEGIAALTQTAEPSRRETGNLRYEVLQQLSRPNHLTLVEAWRDQKALEAHEGAAHTVRFRDVSTPMSGALFDQRLYRAIE
jgi:quinol monooxygenase YgiN